MRGHRSGPREPDIRNGKRSTWSTVNEGTVSVISVRTREVVHNWHIPGGGTRGMKNVSADGGVLWLSGRYSLGHTGGMRW
jgi:hypothetical protein